MNDIQVTEQSVERLMGSLGMKPRHGYVVDAGDHMIVCVYAAWRGYRPQTWEDRPLKWMDNLGPIYVGPAPS